MHIVFIAPRVGMNINSEQFNFFEYINELDEVEADSVICPILSPEDDEKDLNIILKQYSKDYCFDIYFDTYDFEDCTNFYCFLLNTNIEYNVYLHDDNRLLFSTNNESQKSLFYYFPKTGKFYLGKRL